MPNNIVTARGKKPASPSAIRRAQSGGKIPKEPDDNVVREQQSKGTVRPDGPGDATAPIKREPPKPGKAVRTVKSVPPGRARAPARTGARRTARR